MFFIYVLVFCIGLIWGSFANVIVSRLGIKEGIVGGRSECPKCLAKLHWYDLFPIFSYLELRGKCRYCSETISARYPLLESLTGLVFLANFIKSWPTLDINFIFSLIVSFLLLLIIFFDWEYFIIPDKISIPLSLCLIIFNFVFKSTDFFNLLLTGILSALFFGIIFLVSNGRWMGFGDAKLALVIGLSLGYPLAFWSLLVSVWIAAIVGVLMIIAGKANMKTAMPFGSFMAGVAIIFLIFANEIETKIKFINWIF